MTIKPTRHGDYKEVTYTSVRWDQLKKLREKAGLGYGSAGSVPSAVDLLMAA